MALISAIASEMEVLTEAEFLEKTLNTGGTREVVYNLDGFDRIAVNFAVNRDQVLLATVKDLLTGKVLVENSAIMQCLGFAEIAKLK
jgi:hypothetical protein